LSLTVEPGNGLYSGSPVRDNTDSSANLGRYRFTDERLSFSSAPGNSRGWVPPLPHRWPVNSKEKKSTLNGCCCQAGNDC